MGNWSNNVAGTYTVAQGVKVLKRGLTREEAKKLCAKIEANTGASADMWKTGPGYLSKKAKDSQTIDRRARLHRALDAVLDAGVGRGMDAAEVSKAEAFKYLDKRGYGTGGVCIWLAKSP